MSDQPIVRPRYAWLTDALAWLGLVEAIDLSPRRVEPDTDGLPAWVHDFRQQVRTGGGGRRVEDRADAGGLANMISNLGGYNDKGASWASVILAVRNFADTEFDNLYRANHYARRACDMHPDAVVKAGWTIKGDKDGKRLKELEQAYKIKKHIAKAASNARKHGGAVIVLVPKGIRDPSKPRAKGEAVARLLVLERREATPTEWVGQATDARYREPLIWTLSPQNPVGADIAPRYHASRVIYVDGMDVDVVTRVANQGFGDSVFQAAFDAVSGLANTDGAIDTLVQELQVPVIKIANLDAYRGGEQEAYFATRTKQIAIGKSILNMVLMGKDEEYTAHPANVTGLSDLVIRRREAAASAFDIPMTKLFMTAPGGLSTDGESANSSWRDSVDAYREKYLREPIEAVYVALGVVDPVLEFNPVDTPSALVAAQIALAVAQTRQANITSGVGTADEYREEDGKEALDLGSEDDLLDSEADETPPAKRQKTANEPADTRR